MSDLLADAVAELYEADPDGFTERRAELAAAARDAGEPAAAKQIMALRKPTRSASRGGGWPPDQSQCSSSK